MAVLAIGVFVSLLNSVLIAAGWTGTGRRLLVALLSVAGLAILAWAIVFLIRSTRSAQASYVGLASASDLPRSRSEVRALMGQEVAARYNEDAWQHNLRASRAARGGRRTLEALAIFYFVYANFYHGGLPDAIALVVTIGAVVLAISIAMRENKLTLAAITKATGIPGLKGSSTPWRPDEYHAWCVEHDIRPYPRGGPARLNSSRRDYQQDAV
jgi:hypothetical protein